MKKMLLGIGIILIAIVLFIGIKQTVIVEKAHSTFANYYAFRGCTQLIKKTDTFGLCKLSSGKMIKIVAFKGRWYLDGDLPRCIVNFCF